MFTCPACKIPLTRIREDFGQLWFCPKCNGQTITVELIRRIIPNEITNKLWQRSRQDNIIHKRKCPGCDLLMAEVPIIHQNKTMYLDVCPTCRLIWFDTNEFEQLPRSNPDNQDDLSPEAKKVLAIAKVKSMQEIYEIEEKTEEIAKKIFFARHPVILLVLEKIFGI